jgi:hypothetical protein
MFHRAEIDPAKSTPRANEIRGWASFVNSYNPELGRKYLTIAGRLK